MSIEEIIQFLILITFTISFIWIVVFLFKKTLKNQRKIERKIKRILNIPQHPLEVFINQEQIDNDQIETEKEELLINVQHSR